MSAPRQHRALLSCAGAVVITAGLAITPVSAGASTPLATLSGTAPGGPGAASHLDLARKDCFGTARDTTSKVWFTVADGVLSDVYSPTIENTNVNTLQYVVTDGRSFADLQTRDMTYTVSSPDQSGMVCRVTSTDAQHGFRLVTDYVTDPARDSVVMHTSVRPVNGSAQPVTELKVYARYDATIDNSGGGGPANTGANDATVDPATTALISSDTNPPGGPFATQVAGALVASRPFLAEASGFAGTSSDGLSQLDTDHQLTSPYQTAEDGNVVQTALVDTTGNSFTLALGFGPTSAAAAQTAGDSASEPFAQLKALYEQGWRAYDSALNQPPSGLPGLDAAEESKMSRMYWLSANVLKADEDKTYPGAFVASPTDPWGQAVPASSAVPGWTYREVFARDSYEIFDGLLADGDVASAQAMVDFLFDRTQQADGSFPRDSLINGQPAPDNFAPEIDEDSYPLLMAWDSGFAGNVAFYRDHIRPDADFIVGHGPAYGVVSWEADSGYAPSTIAAQIAGLVAAARLAKAAGDLPRATVYMATADYYQRNVKRWTVTSTGPYGDHSYFLRLSPTGDPNAAESHDLGNGSPAVDQRADVDSTFLELTRLGELSPTDPDISRSLDVADSVLESGTVSGPGWHRFGVQASGSTDGYGECYRPDPTDCSVTGAPWFPSFTGSGHIWPLLDGERAEEDLQQGDRAGAALLASTMQKMSWGVGVEPEQIWEDPDYPAAKDGSDPTTASIGFTNGKATGSATPLIWAQAEYVTLLQDLRAGTLLDEPTLARQRYARSGPPGALNISLTAPQPGSVEMSGNMTVQGTTSPGATVDIWAGQPDSPANAAAVVQTVADSKGTFSVTVPAQPGRTVITATASTGPHDTGWTQQTVSTAYPSLSAAYDNVGITSDSDTAPGNLDGVGDSFSSAAFASVGLAPGGTVDYGGLTYHWPGLPGTSDNVMAGGQTIETSGQGSRLGFLLTGIVWTGQTVTGTGVIRYADGTTQPFTLDVPNWIANSSIPGASVAATAPYANAPANQRFQSPASVYATSVDLQPGKQIAAVTLPDVSSVSAYQVNAMHIFAMSIG